MHTQFSVLTCLSFAIASASAQTTYTVWPWPNHPIPEPSPPVLVTTTTVDQTLIVTCPAPPTVFLNITATEYLPVAATTTDLFTNTATEYLTGTTTDTLPITIFQTIISTIVSTTTQIVTETATTVSVSPTTATATATEIISVYEITTQATSIIVCPTRIVNPSYTAAGPYPTDWTWGCPPGWLCRPAAENCNFEAGLPDRNFLCSPDECIPAEVIPAVLPTWDLDIYGNSTPANDPALRINAIDHFFNMDPQQFGLTYEVFEVNDEVLTRTTTIFEPPSPTGVKARQAQTNIPGACYPWCNNCLLEAQSNGKTSKLCVPGSAFEESLSQCEQCISYHKSDSAGTFVQISPQFQQFLDYCEQYSTIVVSTTVTAVTTNAAGSTYSTVTGTISTTVTPKNSASPVSPVAGSTSVSVVATLVSISSETTATAAGTTSTSTISSLSTLSTSLSSPAPAPPASTPSASTPSVSVSSASTPPAPMSTVAYTTTETVVTTTYAHSTVSGSAWGQITIIMPVGPNSTTTLYGSDLTSGSATLVIPASPTTSTYTTTMTVTPSAGTQVAAASSAPALVSSLGASGTTSSPASTFTGAASTLRISASEHPFRAMFFGLALCHFIAMLLL